MMKTSVYSWRLAPDLKLALEDFARRNHQSIAEVLDKIVRERLAILSSVDEDEEQRRLHAAAEKTLGVIDGGDPNRGTQARATLRARLESRRERTS